MARDVPTWSPKVPRWKVRRLYELEAQGLADDALVDDVGFALVERCRDILAVTEAHVGRARCPMCSAMIVREPRRDEVLLCSCGWSLPWAVYHRSYRRKGLVGGMATVAFERFVERYPRLRTTRERMREIDRLIHYFHGEAAERPIRPAARNVIGGTPAQILELLDSLAEGPGTSDDVKRSRDAYRGKRASSAEIFRRGNPRAGERLRESPGLDSS